MFAAVVGLVLDGDLGRVGEVLLRRSGGSAAGMVAREQRDLLVVGGVGEDRLDVLGEAHVEHLVGLVEHQEPQLGQVEGALLEVVHDPAGRADDDVHAAAQRAELDAVRPGRRRPAARARPCRWAAYFSNASHTCSASSRVGASTSACGVFWRRSSWARIGSANAAVLPVPVWARPTTCAAVEQRRDGRGLDRRGRLVADVLERLEHAWSQPEVGEGGLWDGWG